MATPRRRAPDSGKYAVPPSLQSLFERIKAAAIILNKTDAIIAERNTAVSIRTASKAGPRASAASGAQPRFWLGHVCVAKILHALRRPGDLEQRGDRDADGVWAHHIENADLGTDHAEAGVMFVGGGAVNGYVPSVRSGVYNCNPNDTTVAPALRGSPGGNGSMFGVNGRYLRRTTDYRQVLGEIIRDHLGATQNQLNRIIPGYTNLRRRSWPGALPPTAHQFAGNWASCEWTALFLLSLLVRTKTLLSVSAGALLGIFSLPDTGWADTVALNPSADATLFEVISENSAGGDAFFISGTRPR